MEQGGEKINDWDRLTIEKKKIWYNLYCKEEYCVRERSPKSFNDGCRRATALRLFSCALKFIPLKGARL